MDAAIRGRPDQRKVAQLIADLEKAREEGSAQGVIILRDWTYSGEKLAPIIEPYISTGFLAKSDGPEFWQNPGIAIGDEIDLVEMQERDQGVHIYRRADDSMWVVRRNDNVGEGGEPLSVHVSESEAIDAAREVVRRTSIPGFVTVMDEHDQYRETKAEYVYVRDAEAQFVQANPSFEHDDYGSSRKIEPFVSICPLYQVSPCEQLPIWRETLAYFSQHSLSAVSASVDRFTHAERLFVASTM